MLHVHRGAQGPWYEVVLWVAQAFTSHDAGRSFDAATPTRCAPDEAMMILASVSGNRVPVIAQLVQADEDTVPEVINRFNEIGLAHHRARSATRSRRWP